MTAETRRGGGAGPREGEGAEGRERPILFTGPMVRAILTGQKTQTRRPVRVEHVEEADRVAFAQDRGEWEFGETHQGHVAWARCPYGAPGDRLWVRETFQVIHVAIDPETGRGDDVWHAKTIPASPDSDECGRAYWTTVYAATDPQADYHKEDRGFPWRPGIHMPRWASRITLEVTGVRVERVQDITEEDARAEGITPFPLDPEGDCWTDGKHRTAFQYAWNAMYGWLDSKPFSWAANPWVWVVEFRPTSEAGPISAHHTKGEGERRTDPCAWPATTGGARCAAAASESTASETTPAPASGVRGMRRRLLNARPPRSARRTHQ